MLVFRWWWCGDSRGGCGACRARHQWAVHWYVWKDGHLPARRTNRSLNILYTSSFSCLFPAHISTVFSKTKYCSCHFFPCHFCHFSLCYWLLYLSLIFFSCPGTCEDYRLLENMNKLTSLKYMEMKDISINISRNLQDLNNKCESKRYIISTLSLYFCVLRLYFYYHSMWPVCVLALDASLQPYLDQINQIEEQVSSLEQAAYKLDAYSKKLGKTLSF